MRIAVESSQSERRADDAERELIEWKKMQFHAGPRGRGLQRNYSFVHEVWVLRGAG